MTPVPGLGLRPQDSELLQTAAALLLARRIPGRHAVTAAFRTATGHIHTGLHLGAHLSKASICAEAIALGHAVMADETVELVTGVAVHHHPDPPGWKIVTPCGLCRELLCDYAPGMEILLHRPGEPHSQRVPLASLLPDKFVRD